MINLLRCRFSTGSSSIKSSIPDLHLFSGPSRHWRTGIKEAVYKENVQNVHQRQQHVINVCCSDMIALISFNEVLQQIVPYINRTVFQLVIVDQLWCMSSIAFQHFGASYMIMIIHWHVNLLVHFLLLLYQNLNLFTCLLRKKYTFKFK